MSDSSQKHELGFYNIGYSAALSIFELLDQIAGDRQSIMAGNGSKALSMLLRDPTYAQVKEVQFWASYAEELAQQKQKIIAQQQREQAEGEELNKSFDERVRQLESSFNRARFLYDSCGFLTDSQFKETDVEFAGKSLDELEAAMMAAEKQFAADSTRYGYEETQA